jgi:hypothetical protein
MNSTIAAGALPWRAAAERALNLSAGFWFATAAAGQAVFAAYIAALYGGAVVRGDLSGWNAVMPHGLVEGDPVGNFALGIHLALAFVITVGGPLQLVPQLRAAAPRFHRWNGRVYIVTAFVISLAALYLIWARSGLPGWSLLNGIAISINALLIIGCAAKAWRFAAARRFDRHRRWALRLFLAVSGVWFLRLLVMLWILANQGPAGLGENLDGPAGLALSFAQYLIPLGVLELYFRVRDRAGAAGRLAMAAGLAVLTLAMGIGIVMASRFMWLPHIV